MASVARVTDDEAPKLVRSDVTHDGGVPDRPPPGCKRRSREHVSQEFIRMLENHDDTLRGGDTVRVSCTLGGAATSSADCRGGATRPGDALMDTTPKLRVGPDPASRDICSRVRAEMAGLAPVTRRPAAPGRKAGLLAGLIAAGLLQPAPVRAQGASAPSCGDTVRVERGDTLSRIAQRCGIGEATILRANPRIQGSADLQVGATIQLRPGGAGAGGDAGQTTSRLGAFAGQIGGALGDIAGQLGSSAEELLGKNPDLQNRLRQFGTRLGVTETEARAAGVSISPRGGPAGTAVALSAKGLPANTSVLLGGGPPGTAYEVLDSALTGGDGALEAAVRVPGWQGVAGPFVFVVASTERGVLVRSEPFLVTDPAPPPAGTTRP